jgi:deoxyadenosine/deoxycytidine kinase
MSKTITIIGNVGSGKTTLAKILAEKLPGVLIDADPYTLNPFLPLYAENHARWALATELFFTLARATHLRIELRKNESKSKTKIIDSGLLMGIEVYVKHHRKAGTMTRDEWSLFKNLTKDSVDDKLIYPDLVIYCRCDIRTCLERIEARSRKFEMHHSRKYLKNLETNLDVLMRKLKRLGIKAIDLDMTTFNPHKPKDISLLVSEVKTYEK